LGEAEFAENAVEARRMRRSRRMRTDFMEEVVFSEYGKIAADNRQYPALMRA
jgi:hypothetical protein